MSCFCCIINIKKEKKVFDQNRNYAPLRYLGTFDLFYCSTIFGVNE